MIYLLLALVLAGCSGVTLPGSPGTPEAIVQPTATHTVAATLIEPTLFEATRTPSLPMTLRVWLPPQFDPASGDAAARLLQARLQEYRLQRPDVRVELRVKALDGAGGMLDSLATASGAAPLALPDLIALPRPLLETAALKGFLHPYSGQDLTPATNWYPYAHQLGQVQNSTFGLPFAGDALALVYHEALLEQPPSVLTETLAIPGGLSFPAADPQALVTLALYLANGGEILDSEGRPVLQSQPLAEVLAFYAQAAESESIPVWVTQIQSDTQSWEAFQEGQAAMTITWTSRLLNQSGQGWRAAPIPVIDSVSFSLATGWAWALATGNPARRAIGTQLALFLTDDAFTGSWMARAGYLPVSPKAFATWEPSQGRDLAAKILPSTRLTPNTDVLASVGPLLEQAVVDVLKKLQDPQTAADRAAKALDFP
jgi:ABC-type glycerol-3-phosphate transport system substrate-binding protein